MAQILIVDDSTTLRIQLKKSLAQAGFEVIEAEDGVSGLSLFEKTEKIDLIICDVNMPLLDGLSMCERIMLMPKAINLPIIMLTTESSIEMKDKGKRVGVKAWVTKPFNEEKLIIAVKRLIGIA